MKTIKLLALLAAVLSFAACEKNNDTVRHERDIEYMEYTADRWTPDYSRSTNTVHLTTEGEFDTLLGRFCDDAREGYKVALRNAYRNAKGAKEASSYSSDNRQDMKAWMRQKVDEGNTVTVYYDSQNSLWHGSADITALHLAMDKFGVGRPITAPMLKFIPDLDADSLAAFCERKS